MDLLIGTDENKKLNTGIGGQALFVGCRRFLLDPCTFSKLIIDCNLIILKLQVICSSSLLNALNGSEGIIGIVKICL